MPPFSIKESIVMFYYEDLSIAVPFYEDTLGLKKIYNLDWSKIYQISDTSCVGLIRENESSFHKAQPDNAVMLSIVTDEIDAWYKRLKRDKRTAFIKHIYNNEDAPIRAFLVRDPGGYTIEFFQWL